MTLEVIKPEITTAIPQSPVNIPLASPNTLLRNQSITVDIKVTTQNGMEQLGERLIALSKDLDVGKVNIEFSDSRKTLRRYTNSGIHSGKKTDGGLVEDEHNKCEGFVHLEPGSVVLDKAVIHSFAKVKSGEIIDKDKHVTEDLGRINYSVDFSQ